MLASAGKIARLNTAFFQLIGPRP